MESELQKRRSSGDFGTFHSAYRKDIDGLRALAVLSVVAAHIQLNHFDGGYVGVDVFFVISGYLIGSMLCKEVQEHGRINYMSFYERRVRRILPALLVMLIIVCAFAYATLLPLDLTDFAKMSVAAILFSSNIHLLRSGGYFGSDAAVNLLTHTWSLGVEEQFYIVLPPLLMLFRRRRIGIYIAMVALLSFAVSVPGAYVYPNLTFYLLPTRIWELLVGTLTFLYLSPVKRLPFIWQSAIALVGLTSIMVPVFLYKNGTVFPGLAAVPPCLGTAMLIATRGTSPHMLLSWRPAVLLGQLSYSLYLWHWPVVVFFRLNSVLPFTDPQVVKLSLLAISLLLSYLSWRWIETPFRHGRYKPRRGVLFAMTGTISVVCFVVFAGIILTHGAAFRYSTIEQSIASYRQNGGSMEKFRVGKCFLMEPSTTLLPDERECLRQDPARPNVLLLGSSVVAQLVGALQKTYPEINFLQATAPNCSVRVSSSTRESRGCSALMRFIFLDFLTRSHVDAVLFQVEPNDPTTQELESVIEYFEVRGIRVYVMGPQVKYDRLGPALAIESLRDPHGFRVADHLIKDGGAYDLRYGEIAKQRGATYISMFDTLCPSGVCRLLAEPQIPVESDRVHLTEAGALLVAETWRSKSVLSE